MTWYLWLFVIFFALSMFGLGCVYARASLKKRGEEKMWSDSKANAVLAVFFTVIALVVAVDTVYLHSEFTSYTKGQVDCNTRLLRTESIISKERAKLDSIAADYEIAHFQYLSIFTRDAMVNPADPRYLRLQDASQALINSRLHMIQVYADNPLPKC